MRNCLKENAKKPSEANHFSFTDKQDMVNVNNEAKARRGKTQAYAVFESKEVAVYVKRQNAPYLRECFLCPIET